MGVVTFLMLMSIIVIVGGIVEGLAALVRRVDEKRMDKAAVELLNRRNERRLIYAED
jgi:hypothetical protein